MGVAADTSRPVAVFDFDHTLVDTDVAYLFLDTAIKGSPARRLAVGMVLPLLLPLFLVRRCRVLAMSVLMWLATFPLHGQTARDIFHAFAARVWSSPPSVGFYTDGLAALAAHRRLGHRMLIITGSPQELVARLVQSVPGGDIEVIGSRIEPFFGGLIYRRYCMRSGKIRRAGEMGRLKDVWDFGYSDSAHDIPLLARCRHRFLVNPTPRTLRRVRAALGQDIAVLRWTATRQHSMHH